jgi:hypothetical protein
MTSRTLRSAQLAIVVLGLTTLALARGQAAGADDAALAAALKDVRVTLQDGLKSAEADGKPISAKFELADGKLQLSLYTIKGGGFDEVIVDLTTGAVASAETITDATDLTAASAQKAAMDKAAVPLVAAVQAEVRYGAGARAVSIFPELKDGRPIAMITLLRDGKFDTVSGKLY